MKKKEREEKKASTVESVSKKIEANLEKSIGKRKIISADKEVS
jgi:hypothetical protein